MTAVGAMGASGKRTTTVVTVFTANEGFKASVTIPEINPIEEPTTGSFELVSRSSVGDFQTQREEATSSKFNVAALRMLEQIPNPGVFVGRGNVMTIVVPVLEYTALRG